MNLKIFNSLTKKKEIFKPINKHKILIYLCGITVYEHCHIGHARTNIIFDIIVRYFKFMGFQVTFVRNITDIDDKIIKKAKIHKININCLTENIINTMNQDFSNLNILKSDYNPKVTEMIQPIINMIQVLINKKYAYVKINGDIYFNIKKFKNYGKLSNINIKNLQQTKRIKNNKTSKDFVLWKNTKTNEPSFISPWGQGRPGWHIECSAISNYFLGKTFDIHGGGDDLIFPHHENEIAQSEAANNQKLTNYWIHVGMVNFDNKKVSKSTQNEKLTIRKILNYYHPEVLRLFLISTHYRKSINYSINNLNKAKKSIDYLYNAINNNKNIKINNISMPKDNTQYINEFKKTMDNDFDIPKSINILFIIAKKINIYKINNKHNQILQYSKLLKMLANILGILMYDSNQYFHKAIKNNKYDKNQIEILIKERLLAKKNKNWSQADQIRNTLLKKNIILEDNENTTLWKYK